MIKDRYNSIAEIPQTPWVEYWRKGNSKKYILKPRMKAIVDPISKAKGQEKFRGRECLVLWISSYHAPKVGIWYLDTNHYGERDCNDLIPLPAEVINLADRREKKNK